MESKILTQISLDHEDGVVRAQSWLKGHIEVTVNETTAFPKPIPLTLQVVGKEITTVMPRFKPHFQSEFVVFDETIVVQEGIMKPGKSSFPFSLYLPATLAPSMHFESKHGSCKVQYVVKAQLGGIEIASSRLTVIGKPLSNKLYPCSVGPVCLPLRKMSVLDQGCLVLSAKVDNRHVQKGRKVILSLALRNRSDEKIQRVDIQVVEEIYWTAGRAQRKEEVKLDCWCNVDIPGIQPHLAQCLPTRHSYQKHSPTDDPVVPEICDDLLSKRNEFRVQIPSRAFDSYTGELLQISHKVKIIAYTAHHHGRRASPHNGPSISIPLEVFDPPMEPTVALHQHHVPPEKVEEVRTTNWPLDGEKLLTANGHQYPSTHRKLHSDTEFSYSSIKEDEVTTAM